MTSPVFAPDLATYNTRTPYLTAVEFTEAGTGVDVSQLVPTGSGTDQNAALSRVIRQASAWADALVYKVLAATTDIDRITVPVNRGVLSVPLRYGPVLAVTGVSTAPVDTPWQSTALSDLSRAVLTSPTMLKIAAPGLYASGVYAAGRQFVVVTYVNGWTNTVLSGAVAAGAVSLPLASTLGVYAGQVLTVDDGSTTELVTVASSYVFGTAGPVPLAAPTVNAHSAGAAASALPPDIKRAVIALTACLIKTRGAEAYVMDSIGAPPTKTALSEAGAMEDYALAEQLLKPHRRAR